MEKDYKDDLEKKNYIIEYPSGEISHLDDKKVLTLFNEKLVKYDVEKDVWFYFEEDKKDIDLFLTTKFDNNKNNDKNLNIEEKLKKYTIELYDVLKENEALQPYIENLEIEEKKQVLSGWSTIDEFFDTYKNDLNIMSNSFPWSSTKEGYNYWSDLSRKYVLKLGKKSQQLMN